VKGTITRKKEERTALSNLLKMKTEMRNRKSVALVISATEVGEKKKGAKPEKKGPKAHAQSLPAGRNLLPERRREKGEKKKKEARRLSITGAGPQ